jgi:hypothetical protein
VKNVAFIFTGEFGYEVLSFQGILRKIRPNYAKLLVCSYKESKIFYQDFVTEFIELPSGLLTQFDRSDSLNTLPENEFGKLIKSIEEKGYEVFHRRKIFPDYPLDIKLDLDGECGEYPPLNQLKRSNEKMVTFFPRFHTTHPQRNYDPTKFQIFIRRVLDYLPRHSFKLVFFKNELFNWEKNFKNLDDRLSLVENPSILDQLNLQAQSECVVYNHSGSVFLNVLNSERTPIFIYGINSDHRIFPKNNIYTNKNIPYRYYSENEYLSDLDPQKLFFEFKIFYESIPK